MMQDSQLSEDIAIILDCGSGFTKIGYSTEEFPRSVFPSIIGKPKIPGIMQGADQKDFYIGEDANQKRGNLNIENVIEGGIIQNWEDLEFLIFHSIFCELETNSENHPILFTEPPNNPKQNREKIIQLLFESFNIPSFYLMQQPVLTLYSVGKTIGLVLESGEGITHSVPMFEGFPIPNSTVKTSICGKDVTTFFSQLLSPKHGNNPEYLQSVIREIKEKFGIIAEKYLVKLKELIEKKELDFSFTLPDGNLISIGNERYTCPELLFSPKLRNLDSLGIHNAIYNSISKAGEEFADDLYSNIILGGGNTLFRGLSERLYSELQKLNKLDVNKNANKNEELKEKNLNPDKIDKKDEEKHIQIYAHKDRKYSSWIGGSIVSSMSTFQPLWISKLEYHEKGASIVHKKCI